MYMFASSLFDGGHLPPTFVIPLLRVSLCLFRMVHSLIRCFSTLGTHLARACRVVYFFKSIQIES
jgi:hypothetical protein